MKKPPAHPSLKIELLAKKHNRAAFSCRFEVLNTYLKERASQEAKKQISAPFVLLEEGNNTVIGYYTLSGFGVVLDDLPEETAKKLPKYPMVPATLLGRLAIDTRYEGRGYGVFLLMDALRRVFQATTDIASFAIIVDAKDDEARSFYEHYDFITFPDNEFRLFLPMKTIAGLFA